LAHFKLCKLEHTTLLRPLEKPPIERVIGRYKFDGERHSDLPFERAEMLDILGKPEERWWIARFLFSRFNLDYKCGRTEKMFKLQIDQTGVGRHHFSYGP
jgi:hypothetical protein